MLEPDETVYVCPSTITFTLTMLETRPVTSYKLSEVLKSYSSPGARVMEVALSAKVTVSTLLPSSLKKSTMLFSVYSTIELSDTFLILPLSS